MVHYKNIRTYTLLLFLLIVGTPLQAAQLYEEEGKVSETQQNHPVIALQGLEVYDHTLHFNFLKMRILDTLKPKIWVVKWALKNLEAN